MNLSSEMPSITRRYGYGLAVLFALFCFRVAAQLVQKLSPVEFLPPFDAWQSGALAYEALLFFQVLILAGCLKVVLAFLKESVAPAPRTGKICLALGGLYFSVMIFRLVAGLTFAPDHPWFGARIPTFFHLVLASFILLWGHFHWKFSKP